MEDFAKSMADAKSQANDKPDNKSENDIALESIQKQLDDEKEARQRAENENRNLVKDISENQKAFKDYLETQTSKPVEAGVDDEVLLDLIQAGKPTQAFKMFADKYMTSQPKDNTLNELKSRVHASEVKNARAFLEAKYDGIDDKEWTALQKFGEEHPEQTTRCSENKYMDAFYKMYKFSKDETPKVRSKGDMSTLLKKLQSGVDLGLAGDSDEPYEFTEKEARAAKAFGLDGDTFSKFKKAKRMNIDDYNALKGGK